MTASEAHVAAAAIAADPAVTHVHHARAAEVLTLALGVGITLDESRALVAAKLAQWARDDAPPAAALTHQARADHLIHFWTGRTRDEIAALLADWSRKDICEAADIALAPGDNATAVVRRMIYRRMEGSDHGPGQTWQDYAELCAQDRDAAETENDRLRALVADATPIIEAARRLGQTVQLDTDLLDSVKSERDRYYATLSALLFGGYLDKLTGGDIQRMTAEAQGRMKLADTLLDLAKAYCADGRVDSWTEGVLTKAAELGVGGVRRVIYDPARHGEIAEAEPGYEAWFWGTEVPVDSVPPTGETAP